MYNSVCRSACLQLKKHGKLRSFALAGLSWQCRSWPFKLLWRKRRTSFSSRTVTTCHVSRSYTSVQLKCWDQSPDTVLYWDVRGNQKSHRIWYDWARCGHRFSIGFQLTSFSIKNRKGGVCQPLVSLKPDSELARCHKVCTGHPNQLEEDLCCHLGSMEYPQTFWDGGCLVVIATPK